MDYLRQMYIVSAAIWIPYALFQWYCAWKHYKSSKMFQFGILFCFSAGATLRCIWLFAHALEVSNVSNIFGWMLINRTAVLLQFTGLTLLMGLWGRSLILSSYMERTLKLGSPRGRQDSQERLGVEKKRSLFSGDVLVDAIGKESVKIRRLKYLTINAFAWTVTYATTGNDDIFWALVNGIMLAFLSLFIAVGLTYIGLKAWYQVKEDANEESSVGTEQKNDKAPDWDVVQIYKFLYYKDLARVDVRTEVVRTILQVMVVVSVFFSIRFIGYLYRNIVLREGLIPDLEFANDKMVCSIFIYQVPEFFPNISIIIALAPTMFKKYPLIAYMCSCGVSVRSFERHSEKGVALTEINPRIQDPLQDAMDDRYSLDYHPEVAVHASDTITVSPMVEGQAATL